MCRTFARSSRFALAARCLGVAAALLTTVASSTAATTATAAPPPPVLGHVGRWFTDEQGRVITLHGVNLVYKQIPYYPTAGGFGDDDAQYLADRGFNVVRLGFAWSRYEIHPGEYNDAYLRYLLQSQQILARHGIYSLIDSHQDALNTSVAGTWNGFPPWAAISDGLPLEPHPGGLFGAYFFSPAQNRAWANFWADRAAPDGIGVQEHYAAMWKRVAAFFANQPYVVGYDLINEPWPGNDRPECLEDGCPWFTATALATFQAKSMKTIRQADPWHMIFYEPFLTTDFGPPVALSNPTRDPRAGMSFHDYCVPPIRTCPKNGFDRTQADRTVGFVTEFGAIPNPATVAAIAGNLDNYLASWVFWSQDQNQLPEHPQKPPKGRYLSNPGAVRPYPQAVAGTPLAWNYNDGTGAFTFSYSTARADTGQPFAPGADTVVTLPSCLYPSGYRVQVQGATVVSPPNTPLLRLRTIAGQKAVQLTVTRS